MEIDDVLEELRAAKGDLNKIQYSLAINDIVYRADSLAGLGNAIASVSCKIQRAVDILEREVDELMDRKDNIDVSDAIEILDRLDSKLDGAKMCDRFQSPLYNLAENVQQVVRDVSAILHGA